MAIADLQAYTVSMGNPLLKDIEELMDRRFGVFETKFDNKFSALEEKFETLGNSFTVLEDSFAVLETSVDRKVGVFVEHIDDKIDSLAEAILLMNTDVRTLAKDSDLQEVKQDVRTIKAAVTATNQDLRELKNTSDQRLTHLEAAVFHA